jgi:DNA-binding LacI/PurR family transcriptional regulator
VKVSKAFTHAVKLSEKRAYEIAQEAGIHEATLSHLVNGIRPIESNDERVLAVAKVLGLRPEDCFE